MVRRADFGEQVKKVLFSSKLWAKAAVSTVMRNSSKTSFWLGWGEWSISLTDDAKKTNTYKYRQIRHLKKVARKCGVREL